MLSEILTKNGVTLRTCTEYIYKIQCNTYCLIFKVIVAEHALRFGVKSARLNRLKTLLEAFTIPEATQLQD
jgi:hypothetical protein